MAIQSTVLLAIQMQAIQIAQLKGFCRVTLGAFLDDFEYAAGYGDLDSYSGRFCITPEYPNGIYAYFLSSDNSGKSTYPYTLALQYYGIIIQANTVSGKITPTESVNTYYTVSKASVMDSTSKLISSTYLLFLLIVPFIL